MGEYMASEPGFAASGDRDLKAPDPRGAAPLAAGTDFSSSDCGKVNGSASGPPLYFGAGLLAINGNTDLSSCVVGNSGANVEQIYLIQQADGKFFRYLVWVYAQGPQGTGSGSIWLEFYDESGGSPYQLRIYSSTPDWHWVQYNSKAPGIIKLSWSDTKP